MSDMTELFFGLVVGAVVLAVFTLVGHGLWVLLGRIFSMLSGGGAPRPLAACPRCLSPLVAGARRCSVCHWPESLDTTLPSPQAQLALRHHLEQLRRLGLVDGATYRRLAGPWALESPAAVPAAEAAEKEEVVLATIVDAPAAAPPQPPPPPGPSERSPAERAKRYAAQRLEADSPTAPVPPPRKPKEAVSKLLAAFLEEKNIKWGELVGGLLIVGCSIALVISFWSEIAQRPLLKFFVFGGVTASLFGVGFYSERRWQIHTTSRGLLGISVLLVPLNFLAIAAFTEAAPISDWVTLGGELVSLALFAVLTLFAARVLTPLASYLTAASVMAPSIGLLLVRRFIDDQASLSRLYVAAAALLAVYLASTLWDIRRLARTPQFDLPSAHQLFGLLGMASFATALSIALLLYKSGAVAEAMHRLSPLVAAAGVPALATGLLFWRRVLDPSLAAVRTGGLTVGVVGAAVMVGAVLYAWPEPALLAPTALACAAAFAVAAVWFELPAAHLLTGIALLVAWVVTFQVVRGAATWTANDAGPMATAILSAATGNALVPLAAMMGGAAFLWRRGGRDEDARWWANSAAVAVGASLLLAIGFGFARGGDPSGVAWTLIGYTLAVGGVAVVLRRADVAWTASGLGLLAAVQAIVFHWPHAGWSHPWAAALLVHASLAAAADAVLARLERSGDSPLRRPLEMSALATSSLAAAALAILPPEPFWGAVAVHLCWVSAVWLVLSIARVAPELFTAFQAALAVAVACLVTAHLGEQAWYRDADHPWLDLKFWHGQGIALAAYCLLWKLVRLAALRSSRRFRAARAAGGAGDRMASGANTPYFVARRLMRPPWPAVDRLGELVVVVLLVAVAKLTVLPGALHELALRSAAGRALDAASLAWLRHATSESGWLFWGGAALMLVAGLWEKRAAVRLFGLAVVMAAAAPLLAARWLDQVAVFSALRWWSAAFVGVVSLLLWAQHYMGSSSGGLGRLLLVREPQLRGAAATYIRGLVFVMMLAPYALLGAIITYSTVSYFPPAQFEAWTIVAAAALVGGLLAVLAGAARRNFRPSPAEGVLTGAQLASTAVFWLAALAALVVWAFAVTSALRADPIVGPDPASWFGRMSWATSYSVPLVVVAAALVGYAWVDRSSRCALAAGQLLAAVSTMLLIYRFTSNRQPLDAKAWVQVAQLNSVVLAAGAMVWRGTLVWRRRLDVRAGRSDGSDVAAAVSPLLQTQVLMAVALSALTLAAGVAGLVDEPSLVDPWMVAAGNGYGWIALGMAALAFLLAQTSVWAAPASGSLMGLVIAVSAIVPLGVAAHDTGDWLAYHWLLACATAGSCAASICPLVWPPRIWANRGDGGRRRYDVVGGVATSTVLGLATCGLAVRALDGDPQWPWWTLGTLCAISGLFAWLAWLARGRAYLWLTGLLACLAVSILRYRWWASIPDFATVASDFLLWNVVTASAAAVVSAVIDRRRIAPASPPPAWRLFEFHRFVAWANVFLLAAVVVVGLLDDQQASPTVQVSPWLYVGGWLAAMVAAFACLWDDRARFSVACFYCLGLVGCGAFVDLLNFHGDQFWWTVALALGAFSVATSYLWSRRLELRAGLIRAGAPLPPDDPVAPPPSYGHEWLVSANGVLAIVDAYLVLWIQTVNRSVQDRHLAAYALLAQAVSLGLLARRRVQSVLQYASLVMGGLFAVALSWSFLPLPLENPWLHRGVAAATALAVVAAIYGLGVVKVLSRENPWTGAALRLTPLVAASAMLVLAIVLVAETLALINGQPVALRWPAIAAMAAALAGLSAASLAAAVLPGRDPLQLSERGRTAYVYAAEALLGALFLHVRVAAPWLFQGFYQRYWPLLVVGVAFLGVGLAEILHRRNRAVLSKPLENTGALLPILPVLGFWLAPQQAVPTVHYSLTLITVGMLYTTLSVMRRSFGFAILAALAGNGALWYLLHSAEGLGLLAHPQLWLIPPAVCVLVAAYLNRDRLTEGQMTSIRYAASTTIYASSTADVFIQGVAQAPWLPLVLAAISILGVLAGIMLRVRAFLFLGLAFLLVSLFSIIWHAAVDLDQTWIWWASGIVAGVLIIALFGLFERKRNEMLRVLEKIKTWEA